VDHLWDYADAVTPMPGIAAPFITFTIVYLVLAVIVISLLRRQFVEPPLLKEAQEKLAIQVKHL
jgi:cytochrome bd-type quinol oxidase subunit 1